jgi:membrane-associated phospholipid phosphatase
MVSYICVRSMESLVVYGMLACFAVIVSKGRGKRAVSVGGAAALMSLIGFSRPYLGAHYFSDVAGGFAAGGAWLSAVITGWEVMRRRDMASRRGRTTLP